MIDEALHHIEELILIVRKQETSETTPRDREKLVEAEAELIRFRKKLMKVMGER